MRILANYAEKVSTGNYENQTYTVTFEAETEFNNIERVVDYLFHQAKEAVERQKNGTGNPNLNAGNGKRAAKKQEAKPKKETPKGETETPATKNGEKKEASAKGNGKTPIKATSNGKKNGKNTKVAEPEKPQTAPSPAPSAPPQDAPLPATDKQIQMLYRLAGELGNETGEDAKKFLCDGAEAVTGKPVKSLKELSRKNASRLIEKLLEMQRKVAA